MVKRKLNIGRCTRKVMRRKKLRKKDREKSAFSYDPNIDYVSSYANIGEPIMECPHCNAKRWKMENSNFCCQNGTVHLTENQLPQQLCHLLSGENEISRHFLGNVRKYNNAMAMTSLGCSENWDPLTFKISGQLYHRIGTLLPSHGQDPKYLQIYIVGGSEELHNRNPKSNTGEKHELRNDVLQILQEMLHTHNQYVKEFKVAYEKIQNLQQPVDDVQIVIKDSIPGKHKGITNAPQTNEIAIVIAGQENETRDIVIEGRDGRLKRIRETHRAYDALQYPLLFPYGTDGYSINLKKLDGTSNLSAMQFYRFMFMIRERNHLLLFRELLNVFIVDMFVKIESERLLFLRLNQQRLRCEDYAHLRDSLVTDDADNIGKLVILPSSYTGGPRYMCEKSQDGMIYVKKYGTADLFITFTCNSRWEEITKLLLPGQQPSHRYDIISRVFKLKLSKLMDMIVKEAVFGTVRCYMYTVEWQKRGLPHAHILLWLRERIHASDLDKVISAELPDPESDEELFQLVATHMIHGPCGHFNSRAPCMTENKCSKKFPRNFLNETQTNANGYPLYQRRSPENGGFTATYNNGTVVDNRWVVPYNPALLRSFNAHINVESCHSIKAVKYICKYICKGSDLAALKFVLDEIDRYVNGRYVSTSEAIWRIFGFSIHEHYPPIIHLAVHLENGQRVFFKKDNVQQKIAEPPNTTLINFFKLCQSDRFAKTLLYEEVPKYFVWNKNKFQKRKQGRPVPDYPGYFETDAIGRVYTVSPKNEECFYLRMLLFKVRGPTSFKDLRTFEGIEHETYQDTCLARGMLESDDQWIDTLKDAVISKNSQQIRELFAIIVVYCQPSNPLQLYEMFKKDMAEDVLHKHRTSIDPDIDYTDFIFNKSLSLLNEDISLASNGKTLKHYGLPQPENVSEVSIEYVREVSYNHAQLQKYIEEYEPKLNYEQKFVYDAVTDSVISNQPKLFFMDAPGGTGKTFLMNVLLAKIRSNNQIALAVASSGIAATLLDGGRTVHSTFKAPLNKDSTACSIGKNTALGKLMKQCSLIIWDECSMSHKSTLQAIDTTLKDLRSNNLPMGGVTVLFGGDFRQILPVVERGTRADIVQASLKFSNLWQYIHILPPLHKNMRLTDESQAYSDTLLQLGNGSFPHVNNRVEIEQFANLLTSGEELIKAIWPGVEFISTKPTSWISERAILAPLNSTVLEINEKILQTITSEETTYFSIDKTMDDEDATNFPIEFLNSLCPQGMPSHELKLKIGVPVMLLRNLNPPKLCNGTRLIVKRLSRNVIEGTILNGKFKNECVFIPRIPLTPSNLPFTFKRIQFPLKVCFALTINKAQGQSFETVGIHLEEDCFSHGQLYVAASRVQNSSALYVYREENTTVNTVYPEVL